MFPRDDNDIYIAPDVIYLQVQESEVSWCSDKINDTDVEYVKRANLTECRQQRDKFEHDLAGMENHAKLLSEIVEGLTKQRDGLPE